ncbi:hypothetical protein TOK_3090 [Pseudonocardia sp. N23]|nr:hypothetical protein TOK_3090 [Pseudonocardia sp. N23]
MVRTATSWSRVAGLLTSTRVATGCRSSWWPSSSPSGASPRTVAARRQPVHRVLQPEVESAEPVAPSGVWRG